MLQHTSFRVVLLGLLGSFMLVLSLSAFTGTASAATTTSTLTTSSPPHAHLSAHMVGQGKSSSDEVQVFGSGFRQGIVSWSATINGRPVPVQSTPTFANRDSSFSQLVRINLPGRQLHGQIITLYAFGQSCQASTQVYLR